jgi:hypothetical protein
VLSLKILALEEVLESSILGDHVLSLKILALRMLSSGGSPE